MIDLLIELGAKAYDAVINGVCIALTIAVVWPLAFVVVKYTPRTLKALGVW